MNANEILNDEMSLDEKLAAIDRLMNDEKAKEKYRKIKGLAPNAPVDPADLTVCEGCQ